MPAATVQVADRGRRANRTGAQGLRLDTIGGRRRLGLSYLQEALGPSRPPPPGRLRKCWKKYLQHSLNLGVRSGLSRGSTLDFTVFLAGAGVVQYRLKRGKPHNLVINADLNLPTR